MYKFKKGETKLVSTFYLNRTTDFIYLVNMKKGYHKIQKLLRINFLKNEIKGN